MLNLLSEGKMLKSDNNLFSNEGDIHNKFLNCLIFLPLSVLSITNCNILKLPGKCESERYDLF